MILCKDVKERHNYSPDISWFKKERNTSYSVLTNMNKLFFLRIHHGYQRPPTDFFT